MASEKSGSGSRHVRDVMTANPKTVGEKDNIREAARIMKSQDTGVVPVVDGKKIVGLITDRDIVVRGLAEGKNLESTNVNEIMTKSVRSVPETATIDEVLDLMSSADIRRIPVVNENQELVGIVSIGDISTSSTGDVKVGRTLESISDAPSNN
jgi:CBS domain-containing protein